MSELTHLLGRRLDLQILRPNEVAHVVRSVPTERLLVRPEAAWSGENVPHTARESMTVLDFKRVNSGPIDNL